MQSSDLSRTALRLLESLGGLPAAPYYETAVAEFIKRYCDDAGLKVDTDRHGNLLVTIANGGGQADGPGMAFVAHMDHPGFEATEIQGDRIAGRAIGHLPPAGLLTGVRVLFITRSGDRVPGRVAERIGPPEDRTVLFEADVEKVDELPCHVVFDLVDFDLDSGLIRMRALDDLAGCAAILTALQAIAGSAPQGPVYGLLTRAEEIGLVGARLAAEDGLLPENTVVVSVESSRTLPGAAIGGGPVIRVGDALTTFDRSAEAYLLAARDALRPNGEGFDCQRQLMSGGTCEASAFAGFGYSVTGVAFPLGNYHNAAPESTIAAEFIHVDDFVGGVRLLAGAAALAGTKPRVASVGRLRRRPEEEAARLAGK